MDFLAINGVDIHYEYLKHPDGENRPVFLFINSLGTDFRIWDGVVRELKNYGSVLRFDKMGHGLSALSDREYLIKDYADDVLRLAETLEINKVIMVGLSIGGLIAQYIAIQSPEIVEKMVICNSASKVGTIEGWENRVKKLKNAGLAAFADEILSSWFSADFLHNRQAEAAACKKMLCSTSNDGYIAACLALKEIDLTEQVLQITVPSLFIAGALDKAVPGEVVNETAKRVPGAEFVEIEGVCHIPCVEQPAAIAGLILKFTDSGRPQDSLTSLFNRGMKTRRFVLGEKHVDEAEENKTEFDNDFQEYITSNAWGLIWSRPGLTKRERSMVTIAVLAALRHDHELAMHIRATRNTGASPDDIKEVLMHIAIYAGVPVTNNAMKIAKEILLKKDDQNGH